MFYHTLIIPYFCMWHMMWYTDAVKHGQFSYVWVTWVCYCRGVYKHFSVVGVQGQKGLGTPPCLPDGCVAVGRSLAGVSLAWGAEGISIYWASTKCWAQSTPSIEAWVLQQQWEAEMVNPFYRPADWGPDRSLTWSLSCDWSLGPAIDQLPDSSFVYVSS